MFDRSPVAPVRLEVVETEYQPINTSPRKGTQHQVLVAVKHHVNQDRRRHGKEPSLVLVLVKTYGLQFLVSVFYKVPSDLPCICQSSHSKVSCLFLFLFFYLVEYSSPLPFF